MCHRAQGILSRKMLKRQIGDFDPDPDCRASAHIAISTVERMRVIVAISFSRSSTAAVGDHDTKRWRGAGDRRALCRDGMRIRLGCPNGGLGGATRGTLVHSHGPERLEEPRLSRTGESGCVAAKDGSSDPVRDPLQKKVGGVVSPRRPDHLGCIAAAVQPPSDFLQEPVLPRTLPDSLRRRNHRCTGSPYLTRITTFPAFSPVSTYLVASTICSRG